MSETIIAEGKTTEEAILNGLKILNTTRENVDYKIIEEHNKRFFSILAPRVVKVEMTKKENKPIEKKLVIISDDVLNNAKIEVEKFFNNMFRILNGTVNLNVQIKDSCIYVDIKGNGLGYLIGYRGETLDSIQTIINSMVNKGKQEYVKVFVDIEGYRAKREKTLVNLAKSIANTVIRERKSITLEPMTPLERKIIHSTLQNNNKVVTNSVGEEPYRKVVISLKRRD